MLHENGVTIMIYLDIETLDFFSDPHIKSLPRDEQLAAMRLGCAVTGVDSSIIITLLPSRPSPL